MKPHFKIFSAFVLLLSAACTPSDELAVRNKELEIRWEQTAEGWKISRVADRKGRCWGVPDGAYTILFSSEKPSAEPETITNRGGDTMNFDIARFHYIAKDFNRAVSSVPMNRAGEALRFYPEKGWKEGRTVCFEARNELGRLRTTWSPDPDYPADIRIESVFYPARKGYYSVSTPTLAVLPEERLGWSVVPGFFQGDYIQPVFHLAYMYGQGLPHLPVICNDNTVTTMITSMTEKAGNTLALIPDNGYPRSEYSGDKRTHGISWRCGLSHMNRQGELSPTLYYPVLGQEGSEKQAGDSVRFGFRVSMTDKGWYEAHKHAVYDIYGLGNSLALKHTTLPLYKRMEAIWDYILDDSLSFWRTAGYKGLTIGAQDYLGGVVEARPRRHEKFRHRRIVDARLDDR